MAKVELFRAPDGHPSEADGTFAYYDDGTAECVEGNFDAYEGVWAWKWESPNVVIKKLDSRYYGEFHRDCDQATEAYLAYVVNRMMLEE